MKNEMWLAQNIFLDNGNGSELKSYYDSISSLTPSETQTTSLIPHGVENSAYALLFSPWLIYGSVILFFTLFLGAVILLYIHRSLDRRSTMASLIVAIVITSIPLTLRSALQLTSLETRAGPDEVPRQIVITQLTTRSVSITWETQAEKTGSVRVGPVPLRRIYDQIIIADAGRKLKKHSVRIEDLESGHVYEFEILSGKEWYNDAGQAIKFKLGP